MSKKNETTTWRDRQGAGVEEPPSAIQPGTVTVGGVADTILAAEIRAVRRELLEREVAYCRLALKYAELQLKHFETGGKS